MYNFYLASDTLRDVLKGVGFKTVTFGEFSDLDLSRKTIFPNAHIVPGPMQLNPRVIGYTFRVTASDIVNFSKDDPADLDDPFLGLNNTQDIFNDLATRLSNAVDTLRRKAFDDMPTEVLVAPSIDPFMEKHENILTGWTIEITINMPSDATIC